MPIMPTPVIMPKMEMSQEEGRLIEWLVAEGQQVAKGQPLFEVETDKVTVEVESPASGTLAGIKAAAGDVVPVTTVVAYILAAGEVLANVAEANTQNALRSPETEKPVVSPAYAVTPVAQRLAAELSIDVSTLAGTGPGGRVTKADVEREARERGSWGGLPGKVRATPAARRLARENGAALTEVIGSGPRGRVQAGDVARWQGDTLQEEAVQTDVAVTQPEVVALAGMRRTIAQRMTQSWQMVPHVTFTAAADMSAALALRAELNDRAERAGLPKISVTALLVKVCAWALKQHPYVNSSLIGEEIHLHNDVNIGVAVALADGLIVPVVKQADRLGLAAIASELTELTAKAREGKLLPTDVGGGTFTISNLGMFRIDHFTAIINSPQAAILAVSRVAKKQVVIETAFGDEVVIRPLMNLTLSADHRVLDGAVAARFLADVLDALEQPARMLY